ncbi:MAG: hypothetical protein ABSD44_02845 [Terracidiphilus sp.]
MRFLRNITLVLVAFATMPGFVAATGENSPPFTITISASHQPFHAGEKMLVHVALTNVSDKTLTVSGSASSEEAEWFYAVQVHDTNGKDAPETEYGRAARANAVQFGSMVTDWIKPGGKFEEGVDLNKLFDLTSPGEYEVQLSRHISDDPKKDVVTSNKITITVTE